MIVQARSPHCSRRCQSLVHLWDADRAHGPVPRVVGVFRSSPSRRCTFSLIPGAGRVKPLTASFFYERMIKRIMCPWSSVIVTTVFATIAAMTNGISNGFGIIRAIIAIISTIATVSPSTITQFRTAHPNPHPHPHQQHHRHRC